MNEKIKERINKDLKQNFFWHFVVGCFYIVLIGLNLAFVKNYWGNIASLILIFLCWTGINSIMTKMRLELKSELKKLK